MKHYFIFCCIITCSCQLNTERESKDIPLSTKVKITTETDLDSILSFQKALVYEYKTKEDKGELWFFVNENKGQILYQPNDDMIEAVISYPDGLYEIYGKDTNGKMVVLTQNVNEINSKAQNKAFLIPLGTSMQIDQNHVGEKPIESKGFRVSFEKTSELEMIFITAQIPINARQIYGFGALEGDAQIKLGINFLNLLNKDELIAQLENPLLQLKLVDYEENPFYFNHKK